MSFQIGQCIEYLDENIISYNYKNRILAEIVSTNDLFVQVKVLMHPNLNEEGTLKNLKHTDCFEMTNKCWGVYGDHQLWRKFGRAAYDYRVGDIIRCSVGFELHYVSKIKEDIVYFSYYDDGAWSEDFFECSNAGYYIVTPAENRVDKFFGELIL